MKTAMAHAKEVESSYLAGVQARLKDAEGPIVAGSLFKREQRDCGEQVKAVMIDRRIHDRDRFAQMPHGRGITLRGYERRWIFGKRLKSITTASVLAPPGPLLESDDAAPPVSLVELNDHLRTLVTGAKVAHLIGVCSPSGFEPDVWSTPPEVPNVKLVLVEPREGGGWRVASPHGDLDPRLCKLFDPEQIDHKLDRVRREIEARSSDLLTGGLTARALAKELEIPEALAERAFTLVARSDPELHVSKRSGEAMLFRGAPVISGLEDDAMTLRDRIKGLFSKDADQAKKITALSERRAALSGRLDRMYEDIAKLEKKEQDLNAEGKESTSKVAKRRIAGQVVRMQKDIGRCNTSAAVISKQINIISTHVHNLELAQTGSVAKLPSSDELTEAAVNAEEILEQLTVEDDLVSGLEVGMAESAISDEEAALMAEWEKGEPEPGSRTGRAATGDAPERSADKEEGERGPAQAE